MKVRILALTAILGMLWAAAATVQVADAKDSTGQASSAVAAAETPGAVVPKMKYQFDPVVDGTQITHGFTIKNGGTAPLAITRVQTG